MNIIPLQAVPSQTLSVMLGGQNCQIEVYQKTTGVYLDLYINNAPIITTVLCRDRVRLIRQPYFGFIGDLTFADTKGANDPDYTGLGSRFELAYLEAVDLP